MWLKYILAFTEDIVCSIQRITDGIDVPHVADEEFHFVCILRILRLERMAHPVLLAFILRSGMIFFRVMKLLKG